jgi:cytochrome c oxidase subunit 2
MTTIKATFLVLAAALTACSANTSTTPQADPAASASMTASPGSTAPADPSVAQGGRIYNSNCLPCHQENGAGIPGVYPSLAGSPVVQGDVAELALWVLKGQRPKSMPVGRYSTQMMQFGWMKPADAAALFTYLRTSFGNSASAVDAATVAQAIGAAGGARAGGR